MEFQLIQTLPFLYVIRIQDEHEMIDKFSEEGVGYFAIYDGHAGRMVVEYVKENLSKCILQNYHELKDDWKNIFQTSFKQVDDQVLTICSEVKPKPDRSGCTATVCVLVNNASGNFLSIANIGDSSAFLVTQKDKEELKREKDDLKTEKEKPFCQLKAQKLTFDHNSKTNPKEVERIKKEGGVVFGKKVGGQLSVTRAFGNAHLKSCGVIVDPEMKQVHLCEMDSFLIIAW